MLDSQVAGSDSPERLAVLRVLPPVLNSVRQVALSHNWLETSLLAISLQPHLVQALPPGVPPLQQLPKLDNKTAEALEAKGIEGHKWLEKFVAYDDDVEDADLTEAKEVASKWPRLEVVDADFRGKCAAVRLNRANGPSRRRENRDAWRHCAVHLLCAIQLPRLCY